ncbi:hypothetical protein PAMC26510_04790 [Caballeronia sordidicola]|uniref:Uncharacterized protein n=1 Tax=Caballeronia sordidicola TaxID=196367 RepID=A0A242N1B5_CABSO|nr:hypothetical protein PAMC26577_07460 [Caballeronia sordidicola]OTP79818.1 hypothetical protein PAMC26510_04790 [Caballeronia sordidicola]
MLVRWIKRVPRCSSEAATKAGAAQRFPLDFYCRDWLGTVI